MERGGGILEPDVECAQSIYSNDDYKEDMNDKQVHLKGSHSFSLSLSLSLSLSHTYNLSISLFIFIFICMYMVADGSQCYVILGQASARR